MSCNWKSLKTIFHATKELSLKSVSRQPNKKKCISNSFLFKLIRTLCSFLALFVLDSIIFTFFTVFFCTFFLFLRTFYVLLRKLVLMIYLLCSSLAEAFPIAFCLFFDFFPQWTNNRKKFRRPFQTNKTYIKYKSIIFLMEVKEKNCS